MRMATNPSSRPRPDADPEQLRRLIDTAASLYLQAAERGLPPALNHIAGLMGLSLPTVRRLLVTAGVYRSSRADAILALHESGCSLEDIVARTGLSRAAAASYIPYASHPGPARPSCLLSGGEPDPAQQAALTALHNRMDEEALWAAVAAFAGTTFRTAKGLDFTYTLRGNEMFVNRKDKSITRATVALAFRAAVRLGAEVTGPKKLGCFGASYLYPIFIRLGVIPLAGEMEP